MELICLGVMLVVVVVWRHDARQALLVCYGGA